MLAVDAAVDKSVERSHRPGDNRRGGVDDVWITKNLEISWPYPLALAFKAE
jgi:hypothetical protein